MKIIKKKNFTLLDMFIAVIIAGLFCAATASLVTYTFSKKDNYNNIKSDSLNELVDIYASLLTDYYQNINEEELAQSAINGMMNYLGDDYSTYLSQQNSAALEDQLRGTYEGIGVQITEGNVISAVFEGSPAQESEIMVDDVILKVNGTDVSQLSISEVANAIKKNKTSADLVLKRGEVEYSVTVKIRKLNAPAIKYEIKEENSKKIGYLYIETFSLTLGEQVGNALKKMEEENITGLIVDVRDNSGGYLSAAQDVASLFLEKGKVIYSLQSKNGTTAYKDKTNTKRNYPIVILTNKASASASEILAAALKQSYGAQIVGDTTYGKGKVQEKHGLDDGSMVKYTTALWLTPNGDCVDKVGLAADYKIKVDTDLQPTAEYGTPAYEEQWKKYSEHVNSIYQEQLNKALELLVK